jgi:hypothetical protein
MDASVCGGGLLVEDAVVDSPVYERGMGFMRLDGAVADLVSLYDDGGAVNGVWGWECGRLESGEGEDRWWEIWRGMDGFLRGWGWSFFWSWP